MNFNEPFTLIDTTNNTNENLEIFIFGEIDDLTSHNFINRLQDIDKNTPLTIRLSSEGGNVIDGLKIGEIIKNFNDTTCIIEGICFSIATFIALNCKKVLMTENSYFLIHNPWSYAIGDSKELMNHSENLKTIEQDLINFYINKTGISETIIKDLMQKEKWISSSQALELKFIDGIIEENDNLYNFKNIFNRFKDNIPKEFIKIYKQQNKTIKDDSMKHKDELIKTENLELKDSVKLQDEVQETENIKTEATEEEKLDIILKEIREEIFKTVENLNLLKDEVMNMKKETVEFEAKESEVKNIIEKDDILKMLELNIDKEIIIDAIKENKSYQDVLEVQIKNKMNSVKSISDDIVIDNRKKETNKQNSYIHYPTMNK